MVKGLKERPPSKTTSEETKVKTGAKRSRASSASSPGGSKSPRSTGSPPQSAGTPASSSVISKSPRITGSPAQAAGTPAQPAGIPASSPGRSKSPSGTDSPAQAGTIISINDNLIVPSLSTSALPSAKGKITAIFESTSVQNSSASAIAAGEGKLTFIDDVVSLSPVRPRASDSPNAGPSAQVGIYSLGIGDGEDTYMHDIGDGDGDRDGEPLAKQGGIAAQKPRAQDGVHCPQNSGDGEDTRMHDSGGGDGDGDGELAKQEAIAAQKPRAQDEGHGAQRPIGGAPGDPSGDPDDEPKGSPNGKPGGPGSPNQDSWVSARTVGLSLFKKHQEDAKQRAIAAGLDPNERPHPFLDEGGNGVFDLSAQDRQANRRALARAIAAALQESGSARTHLFLEARRRGPSPWTQWFWNNCETDETVEEAAAGELSPSRETSSPQPRDQDAKKRARAISGEETIEVDVSREALLSPSTFPKKRAKVIDYGRKQAGGLDNAEDNSTRGQQEKQLQLQALQQRSVLSHAWRYGRLLLPCGRASDVVESAQVVVSPESAVYVSRKDLERVRIVEKRATRVKRIKQAPKPDSESSDSDVPSSNAVGKEKPEKLKLQPWPDKLRLQPDNRQKGEIPAHMVAMLLNNPNPSGHKAQEFLREQRDLLEGTKHPEYRAGTSAKKGSSTLYAHDSSGSEGSELELEWTEGDYIQIVKDEELLAERYSDVSEVVQLIQIEIERLRCMQKEVETAASALQPSQVAEIKNEMRIIVKIIEDKSGDLEKVQPELDTAAAALRMIQSGREFYDRPMVEGSGEMYNFEGVPVTGSSLWEKVRSFFEETTAARYGRSIPRRRGQETEGFDHGDGWRGDDDDNDDDGGGGDRGGPANQRGAVRSKVTPDAGRDFYLRDKSDEFLTASGMRPPGPHPGLGGLYAGLPSIKVGPQIHQRGAIPLEVTPDAGRDVDLPDIEMLDESNGFDTASAMRPPGAPSGLGGLYSGLPSIEVGPQISQRGADPFKAPTPRADGAADLVNLQMPKIPNEVQYRIPLASPNLGVGFGTAPASLVRPAPAEPEDSAVSFWAQLNRVKEPIKAKPPKPTRPQANEQPIVPCPVGAANYVDPRTSVHQAEIAAALSNPCQIPAGPRDPPEGPEVGGSWALPEIPEHLPNEEDRIPPKIDPLQNSGHRLWPAPYDFQEMMPGIMNRIWAGSHEYCSNWWDDPTIVERLWRLFTEYQTTGLPQTVHALIEHETGARPGDIVRQPAWTCSCWARFLGPTWWRDNDDDIVNRLRWHRMVFDGKKELMPLIKRLIYCMVTTYVRYSREFNEYNDRVAGYLKMCRWPGDASRVLTCILASHGDQMHRSRNTNLPHPARILVGQLTGFHPEQVSRRLNNIKAYVKERGEVVRNARRQLTPTEMHFLDKYLLPTKMKTKRFGFSSFDRMVKQTFLDEIHEYPGEAKEVVETKLRTYTENYYRHKRGTTYARRGEIARREAERQYNLIAAARGGLPWNNDAHDGTHNPAWIDEACEIVLRPEAANLFDENDEQIRNAGFRDAHNPDDEQGQQQDPLPTNPEAGSEQDTATGGPQGRRRGSGEGRRRGRVGRRQPQPILPERVVQNQAAEEILPPRLGKHRGGQPHPGPSVAPGLQDGILEGAREEQQVVQLANDQINVQLNQGDVDIAPAAEVPERVVQTQAAEEIPPPRLKKHRGGQPHPGASVAPRLQDGILEDPREEQALQPANDQIDVHLNQGDVDIARASPRQPVLNLAQLEELFMTQAIEDFEPDPQLEELLMKADFEDFEPEPQEQFQQREHQQQEEMNVALKPPIAELLMHEPVNRELAEILIQTQQEQHEEQQIYFQQQEEHYQQTYLSKEQQDQQLQQQLLLYRQEQLQYPPQQQLYQQQDPLQQLYQQQNPLQQQLYQQQDPLQQLLYQQQQDPLEQQLNQQLEQQALYHQEEDLLQLLLGEPEEDPLQLLLDEPEEDPLQLLQQQQEAAPEHQQQQPLLYHQQNQEEGTIEQQQDQQQQEVPANPPENRDYSPDWLKIVDDP